MPIFRFQGVDRQGHRQAGALAAADEQELETTLRTQGLWLLEAQAEQNRSAVVRRSDARLSRRELIHFCTLMAFQTQAGIQLLPALEVTAQDAGSPRFRKVISGLRERVQGGATFAQALAELPRAFPADLVHLVRAGEQGGALPEALTQARQHLEWQDRIAAELKQATIYPALVLLATAGFVLILFTFVVPKFVALLAAVKVPLPAPTRVVFAVSAFAQDEGWKWLLAAGGVMGALALFRKRSAALEQGLDRVRLSLPVLGSLTRLVIVARFAHNLALLYRNGVSLPSALDLVGGVTGSAVAAAAVREVRRQVLDGSSLSEALRRQPLFPGLLIRLVVVGERTGQLDGSLEQLAAYYHEQLPRRLKRLLSLLEPTLILGLVAIVGLVALAVILPVLSLMQSLR